MPKTDGGPAYPQPLAGDEQGMYTSAEKDPMNAGLSKLERFALAAMQGDWANPDEGSWPNETTDDYLRRRARLYYRMARAMIEVELDS